MWIPDKFNQTHMSPWSNKYVYPEKRAHGPHLPFFSRDLNKRAEISTDAETRDEIFLSLIHLSKTISKHNKIQSRIKWKKKEEEKQSKYSVSSRDSNGFG